MAQAPVPLQPLPPRDPERASEPASLPARAALIRHLGPPQLPRACSALMGLL